MQLRDTSYSNTKIQNTKYNLQKCRNINDMTTEMQAFEYGGGGGQAHEQTNRHTHTSIP